MNNLSLISNNVTGLQAIWKRIKIFEYLKNYVTSNGFIFLQETHSSVKDEKIWNDEFEGRFFFSHGKTNSCGVAIGFVGTKALNVLNIKRDNLGRILVIEVITDDSVFVLINICSANTESEQLHTLNDLINILETFEDIHNKSVVLGGDFNAILNPPLDSEGGKPVIKKRNVLDNLDQDHIVDPQFLWEYLKYEIRKFSIHFSKGIVGNKKTERAYLENKFKSLENSPSFVVNPEYKLKLMKNVIRSIKKKQMVLELEVNVIGTSTEKNLQNFF